LAYDGVVVLGELARVLGSGHFDHSLHPISISSFEAGQGQDEILARHFETAKKKRIGHD